MPAVSSYYPRMASLMVWRRALLTLAFVLSAILLVKTCFDPHTFQGIMERATVNEQKKLNPHATSEQIKQIEEGAKQYSAELIKVFGSSNVNILDTLFGGLWLCFIASLVFQILAARNWRNWRKSRKMALIGVGVVLVPELVAMIIPWASMMNFNHLNTQGAAMTSQQMKGVMQLTVIYVVLATAIPFFYGLVNGILRASLSAKTLVPSSIVCGWGSMLLAATIAVPWYIILSVVCQFEADALIVTGTVCLLAAPLSILFKARRLGLPLTPEEASPLVKRTKLWLTGLNVLGMAMIIAYLADKDFVSAFDIITLVIHYLANLMLVQVLAVDLLVLLLDRAHRKLASDSAPGEALRQLGEVLSAA